MVNFCLIADRGPFEFFFLPPPCICSYVPIKGRGGSYIPIEGLHGHLVFLPNLGALPPVIFFNQVNS